MTTPIIANIERGKISPSFNSYKPKRCRTVVTTIWISVIQQAHFLKVFHTFNHLPSRLSIDLPTITPTNISATNAVTDNTARVIPPPILELSLCMSFAQLRLVI